MKLNQLLGIELPIIQAPMAGVQDSELAIAVCNAGALGSLPGAMLDLEQLNKHLHNLHQTGKPYNVNFFCHTPPKISAVDENNWRGTLQAYYQEFAVDSSSEPTASALQPFCSDGAQLLAEYKPAVVSFHFGLPEAQLVTLVKSWGSKIVSSATTVEEARWLEKNGVDMIIAQGLEAGGHRGMFLSDDITTQVGTLPLLAQLIEAVKVPVIAAGGIADAATVAAVLSMGACGVQVGTAYLLCNEAKTSAIHRQALKSNEARHTALTNVFTGRPARSIVNRVITEVGPMSQSAPQFPLAGHALSTIRAQAESQGQGDFSPLWSGQNNSRCEEVSAATMTQRLAQSIS